jgi:hypothetical protein
MHAKKMDNGYNNDGKSRQQRSPGKNLFIFLVSPLDGQVSES